MSTRRTTPVKQQRRTLKTTAKPCRPAPSLLEWSVPPAPSLAPVSSLDCLSTSAALPVVQRGYGCASWAREFGRFAAPLLYCSVSGGIGVAGGRGNAFDLGIGGGGDATLVDVLLKAIFP